MNMFHIETEERTIAGQATSIYTLGCTNHQASIEVWPSRGFNCLRWQVQGQDLLFSAPDWETNPVPTRSGIPILFPFPNRIHDGQYSFHGKEYQLPKNDSTGSNAIHGFSPRKPWRVFGYGADTNEAWLHGDFRIKEDAPEATSLWPGDAILSVIYRLSLDRLRIEMKVRNMGNEPFPFGLGLHPYFYFSKAGGDVSRYRLQAPARHIWPLQESLPTGQRAAIPDQLNWNRPRMIGSTQLDTVYTDLGAIAEDPEGLLHRATLSHEDRPGSLEVWTTVDFRESVLFTPPHRQAICIEPYTCTTDAVNLHARGQDAGWREVMPLQVWSGVVELRWNP
jgi:aldose 1-epimerase